MNELSIVTVFCPGEKSCEAQSDVHRKFKDIGRYHDDEGPVRDAAATKQDLRDAYPMVWCVPNEQIVRCILRQELRVSL